MSFTGEPGESRCNCGIGRCCGSGTSMYIHWTFWFNVIFQLLFSLLSYAKSWKYLLMIFLVWGPFSVITIIFHEMGHIWKTRHSGGTCGYSMLWPLGGFNNCWIPNGTCLQEFCVAFCGPMMHIPQFFVWTLIMALSAPNGLNWYSQNFDLQSFESGPGEFFAEVSKQMININIMVFVINLLVPAYPMDAANMVAALAVHFGMSVEGAGYVLVVIGVVLGILCLIVGILNLVNGGAAGLFMIFISVFVLYMSYGLYKMIKAGTIHLHPIFKPDCYKGRSNSNSNSDVEMGRGGGGGGRPSSNNNNNNNNPPASPTRRSQAPPPKKIKVTKNSVGRNKKKPPKSSSSPNNSNNVKPQRKSRQSSQSK